MKNNPISSGLPRRSFIKGMAASGLVAATNPLNALAAHHGKIKGEARLRQFRCESHEPDGRGPPEVC